MEESDKRQVGEKDMDGKRELNGLLHTGSRRNRDK